MLDTMQGMPQLRTPVGHELMLDELGPRIEEAILAPSRVVGRELPLLGFTDRPRALSCWQRGDRSWVFAADYRADPTFAGCGGKIAMPADELRAFDALAGAGLDCDLIWIAHELPEDWHPGTPLPPFPDPPRARRRRRAPALVTTAGRRLIQAARALDPVVVGGLVHEQTGAVLWIELSRWDWA